LGNCNAAFHTRECLEREENTAINSAVSTAIKASLASGMVLEARSSDLMVSIFKKSQKRNKKAGGGEQAIRLVLIIVWAIVIVVLGFYAGLHLSHHH
jgi:hypothetical protein